MRRVVDGIVFNVSLLDFSFPFLFGFRQNVSEIVCGVKLCKLLYN